jgi:hypothetical protein
MILEAKDAHIKNVFPFFHSPETSVFSDTKHIDVCHVTYTGKYIQLKLALLSGDRTLIISMMSLSF